MVKQLLKKQMLEMFQSFFVNRKKNQSRSKSSTAMMIIGYGVLIFGFLGGVFAVFASSLIPLVDAGYDWMYFSFMELVAVAMGAFGSVFNTYSSLYLSKDNDFLLSMPIPVRYVMASRLLSVYVMGTLYSSIVIVPTMILYLINYFSVLALIGNIMMLIIVSFIVMVLSCILGWVVAKISSKLKNKSIINVAVSIIFIGLYYFVYYKANAMIRLIIANASVYGEKIKGSFSPLYYLGKIGSGDMLAAAVVTAIVAALCVLTYYIISRSFINIATSSQNVAKKKYVAKSVKARSASLSLVRREIQRFVSSSNYMLNCGFGILILFGAGIFILIKGGSFAELIIDIFGKESFVCITATAVICLMTSMNDMSSPSISLEGKTIWLAQSLPVSSWQVIRAKRDFHMLLTGVPTLFCSICAVFSLRLSPLGIVMIIVFPQLFILFCDCFGLFLNLKNPNLTWTNEITPIKQSMSVMFVLFGGWIYAILTFVAYFLFQNKLSSELYLVGMSALTGLLCLGLDSWLRKKGTKIFEEL